MRARVFLMTIYQYCIFRRKPLTPFFVIHVIKSGQAEIYTDTWMESFPVKRKSDFSKLSQQGGIFAWQERLTQLIYCLFCWRCICGRGLGNDLNNIFLF